jgi:hypothetical protein
LNDAQAVTRIAALTGDAMPDGNGLLQYVAAPSLNDVGQAAFTGSASGTTGGGSDDQGVFLASATAGSLAQFVREGQAAPDGNGTFSKLNHPVLNNAGQAVFTFILAGTTGGTSDNAGLYRGTTSTLTQIARGGQPAPDGAGSLYAFTNPGMNASGQIVARATYSVTAPPLGFDVGLIRGDEFSLAQLARVGQPAPDGNGAFSQILHPAINDSGQVSFLGIFSGTSHPNNVVDNEGVYLSDGTTLIQVARDNEDAPGGGRYSFFEQQRQPALNNVGQVAFSTYLVGTVTATSRGVYRYDGPVAGVAMLARAGEAPPDGNGVLFELSDPALNNAGQVLFLATNMRETAGFHLDDSGLFRTDGTPGSLTQIAREDQTAPDGNGVFSGFLNFALNDDGQVAFQGFLRDTANGSSDSIGLFFYDDSRGLQQVVRTGDSLLGSTIEVLDFRGGLGPGADEGDGFNAAGEIAYRFDLADGRSGIAVWSPPEPGDFDDDGNVDGDDLADWQAGFGMTAGAQHADGDADADEDVDGNDFLIWQRNVGSAIPATPVPEPAAVLLQLAAALALAPFRRGRRLRRRCRLPR